MEKEPRKIINFRNFYPDSNFLELFNKRSIEIEKESGIMENISDEMSNCAENFYELAMIIINQFKSVEDIEDDEFLKSFKNLNFLSKFLKKTPYGNLLKEDIIAEISSYLIRAEVNAKRSRDSSMESKIYMSKGDLDVIKEKYWNALNNYNKAILIARKHNLMEIYYEGQILLGIFYVYPFWRAEFLSPLKKTKIINAGLKILLTTKEKLRDSKYFRCTAECYGELAKIFKQDGNFPKSRQYYLNAIDLSEQANSLNIEQKYCFEISKLYESMENFDEAINFMGRAVEIATTLENNEEKAHCLINLAILYEEIGDIPESDRLLANAEEIIDQMSH